MLNFGTVHNTPGHVDLDVRIIFHPRSDVLSGRLACIGSHTSAVTGRISLLIVTGGMVCILQLDILDV